ncbi:MAG: leucine-rich repeat domain-containing protein [Prevotella sp.]|nr:leucine-rich repeat domain-containing protein [Prevotella sp.]
MRKLLLFLALLPMMASAYVEINGISYILDSSKMEATVTIQYNGYSGDIVIPSSITYDGTPYSVTSIGKNAFYICSGLTSVTIPNSVTSIGEAAFRFCSGLTSVTIPNSVTSIGKGAFEGCSGLTAITIPNSVTSIGDAAFDGCSGLTSVTIPDGMTSISNYAFKGCSGLTSVTIPNSVTSIGEGAFEGCSGLTSVTIPNSVTSIGEYAFDGTPFYNNMADGVIYLGKCLYKYKGTMPENTRIVIANGTISISPYAFFGCSGLTSVNIPNSVTTIGSGAFWGCSGLQEVFCLAASVPSTSSDAFYNPSTAINDETLISAHLFVLHQSIGTYRNNSPWSGFRTISAVDVQQNGFYYIFDTPKEEATVTGAANSLSGNLNIPSYVVYEGVDYDVVAIYDNAFQNCSSITSINIPNIVTTIGNKAFEGCSGLTSLSIGKKIKSIGQNAFKGCSGLNSITVASGNTVYDSRNNCNAIIETATGKLIQGCNATIIPNDVTSIGDAAFYNCSGLTSVTIPNSVTSIGDAAFSGCSGLTAVNIPQGVESIGDAAFIGCSRLTSVTLNSNSIVSADRTENDNLNGIFGSQVKEYVLGDDVTAIGQNAFRGNTKLATITIGNGVTAIGNAAFNGCTGLTSVSINSDAIVSANRTENDNLNSIFGSKVKEYVVGDDVTAIGNYAFQGNTNLSMITLGNSVTSIGSSAFYNCRITSITIPASVTAIGENAFYGCSRLNSTTISDLEAWCNISFGNKYSNPLYQTHHLNLNGTEVKDLAIPTSVNAIGNYAFYGCSGLTSVNIHESVTSIGNQAFSGCSGLTSVTINSNDIVSADRTENDNLNSIFGSQVKEYVVGEDVTAIGQNAFRGNTNLTTVSVGKNIGSIGDNAFYGCSNLATFTCYAADIPTANSSVFEGIDLTTATLYVPASALEEYEETKPWRRFGTILPIDENAVPTAINTAAADDYKEYFDLSGHRVTSTQRGLLIVRDRSGKTRKVMVK